MLSTCLAEQRLSGRHTGIARLIRFYGKVLCRTY